MRRYQKVIHTFCQPEASEPVDTQRLTSSSAPLSSRDCKSDGMRRYFMVIRTFCQPEASEPVDTHRLTWSSAPLSSRDGESDEMRRYLMVIHTFCQLEASDPVDMQRLNIVICTFFIQRRQVWWHAKMPSSYPYTHSSATPTCEKSGSMRRYPKVIRTHTQICYSNLWEFGDMRRHPRVIHTHIYATPTFEKSGSMRRCPIR